jgi:FCP1-like phosphatase family protein
MTSPVEEQVACCHEVVFSGFCAGCGIVVGDTDAGADVDVGAGIGDMEVLKVPGKRSLTLSAAFVLKLRTAEVGRLVGEGKLQLVLDLDHTLVHASTMAATCRVTRADMFKVFEPPGSSCCEVVKVRTHVREFLEEASAMFEMQVYTLGIRPYAHAVVAFLDPDNRYFGGRVVSRCDTDLRHKELTWVHNLGRQLSLIVDDSEDVWRGAQNLVLIEPYRFGLLFFQKKTVSGHALRPGRYRGPDSDGWALSCQVFLHRS